MCHVLLIKSMLRMDPASTDRERNERVEAVINDVIYYILLN